jgi:hypothetical protein
MGSFRQLLRKIFSAKSSAHGHSLKTTFEPRLEALVTCPQFMYQAL